MKLSTIRQLAEEARLHENYQFKDQSDSQLLALGKKAFSRLTDRQRELVYENWLRALKVEGEGLTKDNEFEFIKLRFIAQTNLFFICQLLETYGNVSLRTHEDICNNFFVQKNPTFLNFNVFEKQYTDLKDRMLLVPRGGFKSSIDIADCVQWTVNYPEVTILILTGVYKLASNFVKELKDHFTFEEKENNPEGARQFGPKLMQDKKTGEWTQSLFQVLFAEHCIAPGDGTQFEFQTPAGGDSREPTVMAAGIEQALSGMHFCVLKLDDVVTNENCLTADRLDKVNKQISINRAMLNPGGFMDVIGTWYDEQDFYGISIKQEEDFAQELGLQANIVGSVDSGRFNSHVYMNVYLRSAWWLTPAAVAAGKVDTEIKKEDLEYWFPERLPYEFLTKEKKKDKDGFAIKYLNNPRTVHRIKFSRELLIRRTIAHNQLPPQGIVVTTIDTAYSTKQWADYTVILTAIIFNGRFYVVDMVRDRFSEYDLPVAIARVGHKWKPKRIAIEDDKGVKWMGRELSREMDKLQIRIPVEYVSMGYGSKLRSKLIKAKPVVRLLGDERLYFSNACQGIGEIYDELEKFTGKDDAHDDIVSALSLMVEHFGSYADMGSKAPYQNMFVADRSAKDRYDMIYGVGKYAKFNAADNPTTLYQVETLGAFQQDDSEIDPLSELF